MDSLGDWVQRNISGKCITTQCNRDGCSLNLDGAPEPYILVDMDHPEGPAPQNETRCDYIFVGGNNWVAPIELTRGRADANKFSRQLRAGANIADQIIPVNEQIRFRPIAAYGREPRRAEINRLRNISIRFRKDRELVKVVRCESLLVDALKGI
jgi:hypothetical protein